MLGVCGALWLPCWTALVVVVVALWCVVVGWVGLGRAVLGCAVPVELGWVGLFCPVLRCAGLCWVGAGLCRADLGWAGLLSVACCVLVYCVCLCVPVCVMCGVLCVCCVPLLSCVSLLCCVSLCCVCACVHWAHCLSSVLCACV